MRKDIHPEYYKVTVVMSNGDSFETYSTKNSNLHTTFDPHNHPAWNKGETKKAKTSRVMRFQSKYKQQDGMNLFDVFGAKPEIGANDESENS